MTKKGLEFRVQGLGFMVTGTQGHEDLLGFRFLGVGFMVYTPRVFVLSFGTGLRVLVLCCKEVSAMTVAMPFLLLLMPKLLLMLTGWS